MSPRRPVADGQVRSEPRGSAPSATAFGIDGTNGCSVWRDLRADQVARIARRQFANVALMEESRTVARRDAGHRELIDGLCEEKVEQAGWGVIFAANETPAVRDALADLLEHRRSALPADRYSEFWGEDGFRPGDSKLSFIDRASGGPGPVNPKIIPYYLLLVGGPESISFQFQFQLAVRHAVGRICFETVDEYRRYAQSVVAAETSERQSSESRRFSIFAPANPGDGATESSSRILASGLEERFGGSGAEGWNVQLLQREDATKSRLLDLLGGSERSDLLLTVGHGVLYPRGHSRQRSRQGALISQEWRGPGSAIRESCMVAAEHVVDEANLQGAITFHFACSSAGTPRHDLSDRQRFRNGRLLCENPFVAKLPQRLLSLPGGPALAVIGHVDQAFSSSFEWRGLPWINTFEQCVGRLLRGGPIGWALSLFAWQYAELAADLRCLLEQEQLGLEAPDDQRVAQLWLAVNDSRGYVVLGDPAVRLGGC